MKPVLLCLVFLGLCLQISRASTVSDYIIVGAGPGGILTALAISVKDPTKTITIFEEGDENFETGDPDYLIPRLYFRNLNNPKITNQWYSERTQGNFFKAVNILTGKGLGGSAQLGFMGNTPSFSEMASWGSPWDEFTWLEDNALENILIALDASSSGPDGFLTSSFISYWMESMELDSFDFSEPVGEGVGRPMHFQLPTENPHINIGMQTIFGQLLSQFPNINFVYNAKVLKVMLDEYSSPLVALGVEYLKDNSRKLAYCNKEVILSAGTYGTPKILEQSGIGLSSVLTPLGIEVLAELPVGENLAVPPEFSLYFNNPTVEEEQDLSALADSTADILDYHAVSGEARTANYKMELSSALPFFAFPMNTVSLTCRVTGATSVGSVHLRSNNPNDPPKITLNLYNTPEDVANALTCFEVARGFATFDETLTEMVPTEAVAFDDSTKMVYITTQSQPGYAAYSTCSMGEVVGSDLLVTGVANLRIADASVIPSILANDPTLTIAFLGLRAGIMAHQADYVVDIDFTRGYHLQYFGHGLILIDNTFPGVNDACDQIGANKVKFPITDHCDYCVCSDIMSKVVSTDPFWAQPLGGSCVQAQTFDEILFDTTDCSPLHNVLCRARGQQV